MALDPRISLAGQPLDVINALTKGQQLGETVRDSGVRGRLLRQQEEVANINLAQNRAKTSYNFLLGLKDVPLANRAAIVAQQMPMLTQLGLTESQIMSQDLSNDGLDQSIASLRPMVGKELQQQQLTGVGDISLKDFTAESVQRFMEGGQQDFSVLERVEKWTNVTLPDGTRAQISNITGELRYPTVDGQPGEGETTAPVDGDFTPTPPDQQTKVLTHEEQAKTTS